MKHVFLAATLLAAAAGHAGAQSAANVLVVVNQGSPDSVRVADYYLRVRAVPAAHLVRLDIPDVDIVSRAAYEERIERPIIQWLASNAAYDRILYIVLAKDLPLRIEGTSGPKGTTSSVDSELALLYRKVVEGVSAPQGRVPNPYYAGGEGPNRPSRFTHREHDIFLVTRLDGYTAAEVIALIDRGVAPAAGGDVVLDQKAGLSNDAGEEWLKAAADKLSRTAFGGRAVLEATTRPYTGTAPVIGYYSWGSNDAALRERAPGIRFAPGALAAMFLSSDARTFTEPPPLWKPGHAGERQKVFKGSTQSLTADLVRAGVTGAAGYVAEPYSDGAVRPDLLFPAYLGGFNLAESFYMATPFLGWQTVVIGDPLCAPFAPPRAGADEAITAEIDPATELPAFYSARKVAALQRKGLQEAAVQEYLRGDARVARNDFAGAREPLESATAREPRFVAAQLLLAMLYERAEERDRAIERYRAVLAADPNQPVALNNLAFSLAVHRHEPHDALPLAQKAHGLLRSVASADTLGWVLHLTGDDTTAARIFVEVVRRPIVDAEILLRAAVVFAAVGRPDAAMRELDRAVALDAAMASRADVKELRARITPRVQAPRPATKGALQAEILRGGDTRGRD